MCVAFASNNLKHGKKDVKKTEGMTFIPFFDLPVECSDEIVESSCSVCQGCFQTMEVGRATEYQSLHHCFTSQGLLADPPSLFHFALSPLAEGTVWLTAAFFLKLGGLPTVFFSRFLPDLRVPVLELHGSGRGFDDEGPREAHDQA